MQKNEKESKVSSIVERRGIYYQAFDIYSGTSGFYDYGPIGLRIKRNVESVWRNIFVDWLGSLEVDTTTIVPEIVLKASGHVATFTDPVSSCKKCKTSYRVDKLLEEFYEKRNDSVSLAELKKMDKQIMQKKLIEHGLKCEKCGGELSPIEDFHLMFKLQIGQEKENVGYLRPETAQGIFVDFKNLSKIYSLKLPAAIAQVGKAYRNEISPRQQLVRVREFTQMETEVFFDPNADQDAFNGLEIEKMLDEKVNFCPSNQEERLYSIRELLEKKYIPNKLFAMCIYSELKMLKLLGIADEKIYTFRQLQKEELPHYSRGNVDLEIKTSYGNIEVSGIAYRTDYDLSQHSKLSGKEITVSNGENKFIPHVVEASVGLDRLLFSVLDNSFQDGKERGWEWLKLSDEVSPYKYAVFPLQNDDDLEKKANEVLLMLKDKKIPCYLARSGSIGKRYARADEIGVRYAITCDYDTLKDNTVTIRDRDSAKQVRKKISEIN
ncbi:MAG: glycine--tRNA ligase [Candidatus Micrarchaeia archaeon]